MRERARESTTCANSTISSTRQTYRSGSVATNADSAADPVQIRDMLDGMGWDRQDSPAREAHCAG